MRAASGRGGSNLQAGSASGGVSPATGLGYSGRATNPRLRETDDAHIGAPAAAGRTGYQVQGRSVGQTSTSVPDATATGATSGSAATSTGFGGRVTNPRADRNDVRNDVRETEDVRTGAPAGSPARGFARDGRSRFDNDNVATTGAGASAGSPAAAVGSSTGNASTTGLGGRATNPRGEGGIRETEEGRTGAPAGSPARSHAGEGPTSVEYDRNDRRYVNTPSPAQTGGATSGAASGTATVRPPSRAYDPPEADSGRSLPPARTYGGDRDGGSRGYTPPARSEAPPARVYTPPSRSDSPPPRTYSLPPSSGPSGGSSGGGRPSSGPPPSSGGGGSTGRAAEPRSSSPPPARSGRPH
jgi:hypothetical protein